MGSLHKGHAKLIKSAMDLDATKSSKVLVSVFINPLQFGDNEDFERYPRNLENDCALAKASGASAIWAPSFEEVFKGGASSHFQLKVPSNLEAHLCGPKRPGHFDGVATVMVRLLTLVRPQKLFLGEKDWQQLVILRHLINNLGLPIEIVGIDTVRDADGLAYSSRNKYLTPEQRQKALALPRLLANAAKEVRYGNSVNLKDLQNMLEQHNLEVEYVETVDPFQLQSTKTDQKICILAAAVNCGGTRLIDHTFLMPRPPIIAIDGPAGAGKSTVTRALAKRLNLIYLDTGAMYRAVTWLIQTQNIDPQDNIAVMRILENLNLELNQSEAGDQKILINSHDVTEIIRSPEVTSFVSTVAAINSVREALTIQQKQIGIKGGLVAEGRDIGTAVFPDADLKIFLTASAVERARRRASDLKSRGFATQDLNTLEAEIKERDRIDSTRKISPLLKADDAIELISDGMTIENVIDSILEIFHSRIPKEVWPIDHP